jgi:hypothetical protein
MLSEANYGMHCLVVYPDLATLREFYSHYIQKQIEERNEAVQVYPFYETEDSVRQTLSEGHNPIDVKRLERKEGALAIVDSLMKHFGGGDGDGGHVRFDMDTCKRLVDDAKTMGKSGYSILVDAGAFAYKGRTQDLMEYEMLQPSLYEDVDMKGICLYHQQDFNRLASEQKKKLAEHHGMAMRVVSHR